MLRPTPFKRSVLILVSLLGIVSAVGHSARGVEVGMTTDFSNGSSGFDGAGLSVVADGGPAGAGDSFLRVNSTGGNGPGSRLATFNTTGAFTGDFQAAGITALEVDVKNFSSTAGPVSLRLILLGPDTSNVNRFASVEAIELPNDDQWRTLTFPISEESIRRVQGTATYEAMFSQVRRILLRHDTNPATGQGDPIAGTLGFDNLRFVTASFAPSDFNRDGLLDVADINLLLNEVRAGTNQALFDRTGDGQVNQDDIVAVMTGPSDFHTYVGDSNLDGVFDTGDLVILFQAGQYEDAVVGNSDWSTGDWSGDGEFDTQDLLFAFQQGGFEQGPRGAAVAGVPEPTTLVPLTLLLLVFPRSRRSARVE